MVCLALASTDWYIRQLRDYPVRPFDEAQAPPIWQGRHPVRAHLAAAHDDGRPGPRRSREVPTVFRRAAGACRWGPAQYVLPANQYIYPNVIVIARILQENFGRRPIAWSITTGRDFKGIDPLIVQQGLAYQLSPGLPDTTSPRIDTRRLYGTLLDVVTTDSLLWHTYRYADLLAVRNMRTPRSHDPRHGLEPGDSLRRTGVRLSGQGRPGPGHRQSGAGGHPDQRSRRPHRVASMRLEPLTGPADSGGH